jgi:hypothetical protein
MIHHGTFAVLENNIKKSGEGSLGQSSSYKWGGMAQ